MSTRAFILNLLVQRVGFPFTEVDLSPGLRRKVGELADLRQGVELRQNTVLQRQTEIVHLNSRKGNNTIWLILLIIAGAILLIFIVGIASLIGAYLVYRERQKMETQIRQANAHIATLKAEISSLSMTLNLKIGSTVQDIYSELSPGRMITPPLSQPPQTAPAPPPPPVRTPLASAPPFQVGPNVQVFRETVKEVVMIQCSYCRSLMPQTTLKCPHCGAIREV
ncbi:MAG: hypothetical protein AUI93_05645 [Crenarchaeota archaeon 13_1_40CM_3_52_10]|nr:MAG: hypothetical protein AUI93_05645 [Crenarchaeota archaeon 13_1_40CM_3_52_10]